MIEKAIGLMKTLLPCLVVFSLTTGCANTIVREAVDNAYTSNIPPLKVEFVNNIDQSHDHKDTKLITFRDKKIKPIWIELYHFNLRKQQIDHFYSLEQIATNSNFRVLGSVYFNNHRWVKFAKVNGKGHLVCGFMTRKDMWMMFIYNSTQLTSLEMKSYREYQKTLNVSETEKKLFDLMFTNLDRAISAIY